MADSIREQVVQAFATRINAARTLQLDGSANLPARAVWDTTESAERLQYGKLRMSLDLNVGFMAKVDRGDPPTAPISKQGNAMLAELLEDALNNDPTWWPLQSD